MRAMLDAAQEAARAQREVPEALRPLARESAAKRAQAFDDQFITARLAYWADVLKTTN